MKVVDLEIRISIRRMLLSPDRETNMLGWLMFVDEYQNEIIRRIKLKQYRDLSSPWQAIEFLTKSIAQSKRWKK